MRDESFPWPDCCDGNRCYCECFRPELPWPDSEGWFWCKFKRFKLTVVVECTTFSIICGDPHEYCIHFRAAYHREDWEREFGQSSFVKQLEQPPWRTKP